MKAQQTQDAEREARNAYFREWRKRNPDKVKATQKRFYARYAERMKGGGQNDSGNFE
jgi:uncharacterized short protein YbdD (DUF466 family)